MKGSLYRFFAEDHRRLGALLERATARPQSIDKDAFELFRAGLLKHIGMEEKVLMPAARRARGGEPLAFAGRLHLDHGALAALLVPTPTHRVVEKILSVLVPHNRMEEQPGGLYDTCDVLLAGEAESLLEKLRRFPDVPTAPHRDGPNVEHHIDEMLALAGRARESSEAGPS